MAKIIIKRNKSFCGSAHKFDVYLMNNYIGELKIGDTLEIPVDVGSHMLFFKSRLKLGKSPDTSFDVVVNEPDETVEIKSGFNRNGNFVVEYADNAPHIPVYKNSSDDESEAETTINYSLKDKTYCKKCRAEIVAGAKFCNKCGQAANQPMPQNSNLKYRNLIKCNSCGALVAKNAKACPKCGAPTPGQLLGEAVTGIGCGLFSVPVIIFLIIFYVIIWRILK